MQKAGDTGQNQGMNNVGAHHDLRLKAVEKQEHHHDNAARADRGDADQKARHQPDERHPGERLHGRRAHSGALLDFFLEKQESRNADQQNPDGNGDEMIDAIAVNVSQVNQKTYAQIGSRCAAYGQRQDYFAANRPLAQVNNTGADFSEEVEQRVRAYGAKRRHSQTEDEDREQQNAAPNPRHSDEGPDSKTNQTLDQQIHDSTGFSLSTMRRAGEYSDRLRRCSDKTFPLEVENNFLRRLLRGQLAGIDGDLGVGGNFIRIGNARELFENSSTRFRIQALAIALLT